MEDDSNSGFRLVRHCVSLARIDHLRDETDRLSSSMSSAGIRNLFASSGQIRDLALSEELGALLPSKEYRPVRSLLFDKSAEKNWPVAWHQDRTIAVAQREDVDGFGPWSQKAGIPHVEPPVSILKAMVTLRVHLDDTPVENGALEVCPGSHRLGLIESSEFDDWVRKETVTVDCEAGDVLLMSPLLLHSSGRSQTPSRRRVLHFEYARRTDLPEPLDWYENAEVPTLSR